MRPDLLSDDSGDEIARAERGARSLVSAALDLEDGEVVVKIGDSGARPEGSTGRHKIPFSVLLEVIAVAAESEKVEDITDLIARSIAVFIPAKAMRAQFAQEVQKCKGHIANLSKREERKNLTASLRILGALDGAMFERAFGHLKTGEFSDLYSALGALQKVGVEANRQSLKASIKAGRKAALLHAIEHLGNKFLELTDQDDITFDSDPDQLFCIHASSGVVEAERVKAAKNALMAINMIASLVDDPLGKKMARFNAEYSKVLPGNQPNPLKLGVFRAAGKQLARMPDAQREEVKTTLIQQVTSWCKNASPNEELERKVATCFFELLDFSLETFAASKKLEVELIRYEAAMLLAFRHIVTGTDSEGKVMRIRVYFREQIAVTLEKEIGSDKDKLPSLLTQRLEGTLKKLSDLRAKAATASKDKKKEELTKGEKKELTDLTELEPQIRSFLEKSRKIRYTPVHHAVLQALPSLSLGTPTEEVATKHELQAAYASGPAAQLKEGVSGGPLPREVPAATSAPPSKVEEKRSDMTSRRISTPPTALPEAGASAAEDEAGIPLAQSRDAHRKRRAAVSDALQPRAEPQAAFASGAPEQLESVASRAPSSTEALAAAPPKATKERSEDSRRAAASADLIDANAPATEDKLGTPSSHPKSASGKTRRALASAKMTQGK